MFTLPQLTGILELILFPNYFQLLSVPFVFLGSSDSSSPASKEAKASLARHANEVRKQLLDEIRTGYLSGRPLALLTNTETAASSNEFKGMVTAAFELLLKERSHVHTSLF